MRISFMFASSVGLSAFFFQAEDGIRAGTVTGVQTCALPISHVKGVVVLDEFFAAKGVHDRSLELAGNLHQLPMGSGAARTAEDRDLFRSIQEIGKDIEFFIRWTNAGFR